MLFMFLLGLTTAPTTPAASAGGPDSQHNSLVVRSFADAEDEAEDCPNARVRQADRMSGAQAQRLDELPPGRLELTVLRQVDGCAIPAVVRESIGGNPEADRRR